MRTNSELKPSGLRNDDVTQLIYEIIYVLVNNATVLGLGGNATHANFTISVQGKDNAWTGANEYVFNLQPNGWNQMFALQAIHEILDFVIDTPTTGITEADFTGKVADMWRSLKGGTTTKNFTLFPDGVSQGDLCQILYEIVEGLIDDVGVLKGCFTLDVEDKSGNVAGVSG